MTLHLHRMGWLFALLLFPLEARSVPTYKVGIWFEKRTRMDSVQAYRWSARLVGAWSHLLEQSPGLAQRAELAEFHWVTGGALPISGGDPRHHPDLRVQTLDLQWGVTARDDTTWSALRATRSWLVARGCPDDLQFTVGWDFWEIPPTSELQPFPVADSGGYIHKPVWKLLDSSGIGNPCRRQLAQNPPNGHLSASDSRRIGQLLASRLRHPLDFKILDDAGRPAKDATVKFWKGIPDPRRPFGARFTGPPDSMLADSLGNIALDTGLDLFGGAHWSHGLPGSSMLLFWSANRAGRHVQGWLDAVDLIQTEQQGSLHWQINLPSGSSKAWQEASAHWPNLWLSVDRDSAGLVLGISCPEAVRAVVRILGGRGQILYNTQPMELEVGVHEKRIRLNLPGESLDVRMDTPSDRLQVRLSTPSNRLPAN